jgi:serine-type D-Ala-D-Ala carboxypeptidase (penicillin-binding protein 5/6)
MLTRRSALLGSALVVGALPLAPAAARPAHPKTGAHGGKGAPGEATLSGDPAQTPIGPVDTAARWAFAVDFNTGAQLLDKSADDEMPPSSMTKLMTLYIVYSRLKEGRLKLDDMLTVSEKAWRMGGSKMFVQVGSQVSVEDLIRGIEVDSGNDACIVLAEAIAGSEQQFADLMNETAKKLDLTHSFFKNCTGWPEDGHYMSARDIATLAGDIIRRFPDYYHFASEKTFRYDNIEQANRNPLVQHGTADGLKTGHTEAGGFGLVASTLRDDRRVILVLNGMNSMRERAEEGERLMNWAFANFEDVTLFAAGDPVERVPVWLGESPTVPLVGSENLAVTLPRNWRRHASVRVDYESPVRAPVARGAPLGKLVISGTGMPEIEMPLVAGADVPKLGLPGRAMAVLAHYVQGI